MSNFPVCCSHLTAIFPEGLLNEADALSIGPGAMSTLFQATLPSVLRFEISGWNTPAQHLDLNVTRH